MNRISALVLLVASFVAVSVARSGEAIVVAREVPGRTPSAAVVDIQLEPTGYRQLWPEQRGRGTSGSRLPLQAAGRGACP